MSPAHELPDQPHPGALEGLSSGDDFFGPLTGLVAAPSADAAGAAAMIEGAVADATAQLADLGTDWGAVRYITIRLGPAEEGVATWEAFVAPADPDAPAGSVSR